jgi:hypothetical protein
VDRPESPTGTSISGGRQLVGMVLENHGAESVPGFMAHHGVKGMRWGVRKSESSGSSAPSHASQDHLVVEAHKARAKEHGVQALSNHDLQTVLTRADLESRFNNHKKNEKNSFDKSHGHIKRIISVGKTINDIHNTVNGPVGKAIKTAYKAKKVVG